MINKYNIKDVTPESQYCALLSCPAIYEGFKEITPESQYCALLSCPAVYSSENKQDVYLIVGKLLPKDSLKGVGLGDLEKKIGEDEVLIEVPRGLIGELKVEKSK